MYMYIIICVLIYHYTLGIVYSPQQSAQRTNRVIGEQLGLGNVTRKQRFYSRYDQRLYKLYCFHIRTHISSYPAT